MLIADVNCILFWQCRGERCQWQTLQRDTLCHVLAALQREKLCNEMVTLQGETLVADVAGEHVAPCNGYVTGGMSISWGRC